LSPPCLHPLALMSSLGICGFVGTGTAVRQDERDLRFKITLILSYDVNMNDSNCVSAV
jgi:hypothetical protein